VGSDPHECEPIATHSLGCCANHVATLGGPVSKSDAPRRILRAARVLDPASSGPLVDAEVVVEDDVIRAIRPWGGPASPTDVIEEFPGATILPGLVDAHVHYTIDGREEDAIHRAWERHAAETSFVGARNARLALASGVTTARSAGAAHDLDIPLARAIAAGLIPGPRLLPAGAALTITGGHGRFFGTEVDDVPSMVRETRRLVRDGASHVKVVASEAAMLVGQLAGVSELGHDEIAPIVAETARLGRRVMAHAQNSASVVAAATAGVTTVEHAFLADDAALRVLKERGAYLTPTLAVTDVYACAQDLAPAVAARQREISEQHRASCQRAIELGIPLLAGSDCGVPRIMPDMLAREVRLLEEHGLSALEALRAATLTGAQALGVDHLVGSLEVGLQADLLVVPDDPLHDLRVLERPIAVFQGGIPVARDGVAVIER